MRKRLEQMIDRLANATDGQPGLRRAAMARGAELAGGALPASDVVPAPLQSFLDRVIREAWKITDEDVEALRTSGVNEDTIFEATVAAATGASIARYQIAMRAVAAARRGEPAQEVQ